MVDDHNLSVVDKWKYFTLKTSYTEDEIVRRLKKLRDENTRKEISFHVEAISWTERISREMILTFQHYKKRRQWNEAKFYDLDPANSVHAHEFLQSPFTVQRFKWFYFDNYDYVGRPMEIQLASSLGYILRNGRQVERVKIHNFEIGQDAMSVLSDGLETIAGSGSDSPQELVLDDIRFSYDGESSETRRAEQCLADGLARNKTLTSFRLLNCDESDSTTATIIRGLIGHQSLTKLQLDRVTVGKAATSAICGLLASPTCNLSDLLLSHHMPVMESAGNAEFKLDRFVDQLHANASLQSLNLSSLNPPIDDDSANLLLRNLWKLKSLKHLQLSGNSIRNLVRLAENVTMTTPHSRLQVLDLTRNYFDFGGRSMSDEQSTRAILHLLEVFPELGDLGYNVAEQFPASVTERMALNRR